MVATPPRPAQWQGDRTSVVPRPSCLSPQAENGQIIESALARPMCYHSVSKAVAGSVPCSATTSPKSPTPEVWLKRNDCTGCNRFVDFTRCKGLVERGTAPLGSRFFLNRLQRCPGGGKPPSFAKSATTSATRSWMPRRASSLVAANQESDGKSLQRPTNSPSCSDHTTSKWCEGAGFLSLICSPPILVFPAAPTELICFSQLVERQGQAS